eukprot:760467-Hanusia_phi.AAC.1
MQRVGDVTVDLKLGFGCSAMQLEEFEEAREALLADIAEGLGNVVTNMGSLNRNLESIMEVGDEIGKVSEVWQDFQGKSVAK